MKNDFKLVEVVRFFIPLLCHLFIFFQFLLIWPQLNVPGFWKNQFLILLSLSWFFSLLMFILHKTKMRFIFFFLKVIIVFVLSIPQGSYLWIETILFSILIFETFIYMPKYVDSIISAAVILFAILLQRPVLVWDRMIDSPSSHDLITMGFILFIITLLSGLYKYNVLHTLDLYSQSSKMEDVIKQLTAANIGYQQYADGIEKKSAEEERHRITAEIHDTIGYTLINIMMMMEEALLTDVTEKIQLHQLHLRTKQQAQTGLLETRKALRLLRSIQKTEPVGLKKVSRLIRAFKDSTGIEIFFERSNLPNSISEEIDELIYRMVQEGLVNSFRHGHATKIVIYFWKSEKEIVLNIHDNGEGSKNTDLPNGIGLNGMKERIERVGGSFQAGNVEDGFQIIARIPFNFNENE